MVHFGNFDFLPCLGLFLDKIAVGSEKIDKKSAKVTIHRTIFTLNFSFFQSVFGLMA